MTQRFKMIEHYLLPIDSPADVDELFCQLLEQKIIILENLPNDKVNWLIEICCRNYDWVKCFYTNKYFCMFLDGSQTIFDG